VVKTYRLVLVIVGALVSTVLAVASDMAHGPKLIAGIQRDTQAALDAAGAHGVTARFTTESGLLTRHPRLLGGNALGDSMRLKAAHAVAMVPGVGGVTWAARGGKVEVPAADAVAEATLHCQKDVEAVLKVRSIRFSEASATIDPASSIVLDEVASALRPCVGGIIAITGHANAVGDQGLQLALSIKRAEAVRDALRSRGIPSQGLRPTGVGSQEPLPGLDPTDPANRRIEFSVIATVPLRLTPVDTPGSG
jgi:OOP family OmpA-OmpF porin